MCHRPTVTGNLVIFFFWWKRKMSMRLTFNGSNERTNQTACMIQLIIKLEILTHRFWLDIKMYFWQLSSELFRFAFQIDKLDYFCSHKLNGRLNFSWHLIGLALKTGTTTKYVANIRYWHFQNLILVIFDRSLVPFTQLGRELRNALLGQDKAAIRKSVLVSRGLTFQSCANKSSAKRTTLTKAAAISWGAINYVVQGGSQY